MWKSTNVRVPFNSIKIRKWLFFTSSIKTVHQNSLKESRKRCEKWQTTNLGWRSYICSQFSISSW